MLKTKKIENNSTESLDDVLSEINDINFEIPTEELKQLAHKALLANIETNNMTTEDWADRLANDISKEID